MNIIDDERLKVAESELASSLHNISRSQVIEFCTLRNPHQYLIRVFEVICILFDEKNISLINGKKIARQPGFVNSLYHYNKEDMTTSKFKRLKKLIEDPRYQPSYFEDYKPAAALMTFVVSLVKYVDMIRSISGLYEACRSGNRDRVRQLLAKEDTDVNETAENNESCLVVSLLKGNLDIAKLLIENGANIHEEECISTVILRGYVELFHLLLARGINLSLVRSDGRTLYDIAKRGSDHHMIELLIQYHAGSMIKHIESLQCAEDCEKFFSTHSFSLELLTEDGNSLWFYLVQVQSPLLLRWVNAAVRQIVSAYPQLANAQDSKQRSAVDLAAQENKLAIKAVFLWHGRYRITENRPEHISATCFVYRATDEMECDEAGNARRVCLKFMRYKSHYVREMSARELKLEAEFVVDILRCYPAVDQLHAWPDDTFSGENNSVGYSNLTKTLAENMFMIVMPLADRNMFVSLKQERYAGRNMEEVRYIFAQLVRCVQHLHSRGLLHGDVKPLNIVRVGTKWKLIDLDAACRMNADSDSDSVGFKSSTAYVPPEMFQIIEEHGRKRALLRSVDRAHPLAAHPSFDIWSLGCVLYQLCHADVLPLFPEADQDDNIVVDQDAGQALLRLAAWDDDVKRSKLLHIKDRLARNLVAQMLTADPLKRPTVDRVLSHPFITGRSSVRMLGEAAKYDVFLSYRVQSDSHHATALYRLLTEQHGLSVFLDKECLEPGKNWKEGFCAGLVNSKMFVCLLSKGALNSPTIPRQNLSALTRDSPCDNVFLEHRFALELKQLGMIDIVYPILIGDVIGASQAVDDDHHLVPEVAFLYGNYFADKCAPQCPNISVSAVEKSLAEHMESQGLGSPVGPDRTVAAVYQELLEIQSFLVEGEGEVRFAEAAALIKGMAASKENSRSHTEAQISTTTSATGGSSGSDSGVTSVARSGSGPSFTEKIAVALRAENELFKETIEQQQEEIRLLREAVERLALGKSGN